MNLVDTALAEITQRGIGRGPFNSERVLEKANGNTTTRAKLRCSSARTTDTISASLARLFRRPDESLH